MKKNHNKIILGLLTMTLFAGSLATIAYLTKPTETLENVFTVGKINEPVIDEPNWAGKKPEIIPEIVPGKIIAKDPTITIGENSIDSYVYMAVRSKLVYKSEDGNLTDAVTYLYGPEEQRKEGRNPKWKPLEPEPQILEDGILYLYRYETIVKKSEGDTQLESLFDAVTFHEKLTSDQIDSITLVDGTKQSILVKGFIHQANIKDMELDEIDKLVLTFFLDPKNWNESSK